MKKQKMNVLFKIAFILLIICVLLILASIIIAYAFDSEKWSAITSASGVLLATVGIILGMLSKPKKVKLKDENKEKQLTLSVGTKPLSNVMPSGNSSVTTTLPVRKKSDTSTCRRYSRLSPGLTVPPVPRAVPAPFL